MLRRAAHREKAASADHVAGPAERMTLLFLSTVVSDVTITSTGGVPDVIARAPSSSTTGSAVAVSLPGDALSADFLAVSRGLAAQVAARRRRWRCYSHR